MGVFWVYILSCQNNSFYVGYTNNLIKRYQLHVKGKAAKFTRSFPPLRLAQSWPVFGLKEAMHIERFIKKLNKVQKQNLVDNPGLLEALFMNYLSAELE